MGELADQSGGLLVTTLVKSVEGGLEDLGLSKQAWRHDPGGAARAGVSPPGQHLLDFQHLLQFTTATTGLSRVQQPPDKRLNPFSSDDVHFSALRRRR